MKTTLTILKRTFLKSKIESMAKIAPKGKCLIALQNWIEDKTTIVKTVIDLTATDALQTYSRGHQQDNGEFLLHLNEAIEQELTDAKKTKTPSHLLPTLTAIQKRRCNNCEHNGQKKEPQAYVLVDPNPKWRSIQHFFDAYAAVTLAHDYKCAKCSTKNSTHFRCFMTKVPDTLIIQAQRGHREQWNQHPLTAEHTITLPSPTFKRMKLRAIITHDAAVLNAGNESAGHYIAHLTTEDGWLTINSTFKDSTEQHSTSQPYNDRDTFLFIYQEANDLHTTETNYVARPCPICGCTGNVQSRTDFISDEQARSHFYRCLDKQQNKDNESGEDSSSSNDDNLHCLHCNATGPVSKPGTRFTDKRHLQKHESRCQAGNDETSTSDTDDNTSATTETSATTSVADSDFATLSCPGCWAI